MRVIQSAAFKLTLWYLGIIMVLSILFSIGLYRNSSSQLINTEERQRDAIARLLLPPELEPSRIAYQNRLDADLEGSLRHLQVQLLGLNILTLLIGGGLSYALARRTLQPIEDALDAQGRFTADASHELRTPLTAMRSEIEVALRQPQISVDEARELLGSNLEEIAKLEALSAGLLRLARFENGLDPAVVSDVPVRELFEATIDRYQAQLADRHIELDVSTGEETIAGDPASLTEMIAVLLDNAIKYSPPRSTIKLVSQVTGQFVRISVVDRGVGIKASDMPHIFDRFYRSDRSRSKEEVAGYGLGLSIAKRVTDIHHGDISVVSTPGSGTTFKVKIPIHYVQKVNFF
jgi:two-component system sensor histidine kinase CiaH